MDLTLRKVDFDKAADEIMARIERDGAIHRSSIVDAMVAVAATVPAVANVVPARGLAATVVDSEHDAYDKWLSNAGNDRQVSATLGEYVQMAKQAADARLAQAEQRPPARIGYCRTAATFFDTNGAGWYAARPSGLADEEYVHQDGTWHRSPWSKGRPAGYFQTKQLVEAALRQAEQRRRSERDN